MYWFVWPFIPTGAPISKKNKFKTAAMIELVFWMDLT